MLQLTVSPSCNQRSCTTDSPDYHARDVCENAMRPPQQGGRIGGKIGRCNINGTVTRNATDAEIARYASRLMLPKCKVPCILSRLHWFFSVEFGITGYYDPGRLWRAGSQDTDLPCHMPFLLFVAFVITVHHRYRQTIRQTDVMHVA